MSRVGYKPITVPSSVIVTILDKNFVTVKGPKGELNRTFAKEVIIKQENSQINLDRINDAKVSKQLHGTSRALLNGMVEGVSEGFTKTLVITGIGYRGQMVGEKLQLAIGYSHPVILAPLPNVKISLNTPTEVVVTGCDKQAVGQMAALIRAVREPEPYNGKGIAYKGEKIIRKEGKKAGKK